MLSCISIKYNIILPPFVTYLKFIISLVFVKVKHITEKDPPRGASFLSVCLLILVYGVVFAEFTTNVFTDNLVDKLLAAIKLNGTLTVTTVPKAVM